MTLRIAVFREGRFWLAQGLEHDFGVQAENLQDLLIRISVALDCEGAALADRPAAPPYFQALWPARAGILVTEGMPANISLGMIA